MSYPLEAARTLRREELETAKRALGSAIARVEEAEAVVERARQREVEHAGKRREAELQATGLGARSASALLQDQAWLDRLRAEAELLAGKVRAARDALAEARAEVERAREALAEARAQAEAVERHHAKWLDEKKRSAERKAEDEADDRSASRSTRE